MKQLFGITLVSAFSEIDAKAQSLAKEVKQPKNHRDLSLNRVHKQSHIIGIETGSHSGSRVWQRRKQASISSL
jgi:hypothetical protein